MLKFTHEHSIQYSPMDHVWSRLFSVNPYWHKSIVCTFTTSYQIRIHPVTHKGPYKRRRKRLLAFPLRHVDLWVQDPQATVDAEPAKSILITKDLVNHICTNHLTSKSWSNHMPQITKAKQDDSRKQHSTIVTNSQRSWTLKTKRL